MLFGIINDCKGNTSWQYPFFHTFLIFYKVIWYMMVLGLVIEVTLVSDDDIVWPTMPCLIDSLLTFTSLA